MLGRLKLTPARRVLSVLVGLLAIAAPLQECNVSFGPDGCIITEFGDVQEVSAPLTVSGDRLVDDAGRTVMLRAVNMGGTKTPPFIPTDTAADLDPLPEWGFNAIRLPFTWEAYEPFRCYYQEEYLDQYEQIVEWAAERDLLVVVDFHQDAFARYAIDGCGSGAPDWAIPEAFEIAPPLNDALNCSLWSSQMVADEDHHEIWKSFHANDNGVRARYLEMVGRVADRMSNHSNIVGYEIMNEPWGNEVELGALRKDVGNAIRDRHPSSILFMPSHALGSGGIYPDGTPERPPLENIVYSPHYYDAAVLVGKQWLGASPIPTLDFQAETAASWGAPLFLSEFGIPGGTTDGHLMLNAIYDWNYGNFHSSAVWNYTPNWDPITRDGWNGEDLSIAGQNGQLRLDVFIPRPSPMVIAGEPVNFRGGAWGMTSVFRADPSLGASEFYVPGFIGSGKTISTTGPIDCSLSGTALTCEATGSGVAGVSLAAG